MVDKCKNCEYLDECQDALAFGYCPHFDDGEDYSTAVYREIKEQNGEA